MDANKVGGSARYATKGVPSSVAARTAAASVASTCRYVMASTVTSIVRGIDVGRMLPQRAAHALPEVLVGPVAAADADHPQAVDLTGGEQLRERGCVQAGP